MYFPFFVRFKGTRREGESLRGTRSRVEATGDESRGDAEDSRAAVCEYTTSTILTATYTRAARL